MPPQPPSPRRTELLPHWLAPRHRSRSRVGLRTHPVRHQRCKMMQRLHCKGKKIDGKFGERSEMQHGERTYVDSTPIPMPRPASLALIFTPTIHPAPMKIVKIIAHRPCRSQTCEFLLYSLKKVKQQPIHQTLTKASDEQRYTWHRDTSC